MQHWPYLFVNVSDKNVQSPDQAFLQIRNVGQVLYPLVVHLNGNIERPRVDAAKHINFQDLISRMEVERVDKVGTPQDWLAVDRKDDVAYL